MAVEVESFDSVDLVTVSGRIDSESAPALDGALKQLTEQGRYKLVLDMAGVEYFENAGVQALVSAMRICRERFGDVRIADPSVRVAEAFEHAGLTSQIVSYDDVSAAVGSF